MDATHIAVVEDDNEIRALVVDLLRGEGFEVSGCRTGQEFDRLAERQRIDLAVLDLMLPGEDGLSICRRLRGDIPVLMVTAKGEDVDRIVGLEIGADDYLAKPFNPRELTARVRAILRRTRERERVSTLLAEERYAFLGWTLDIGARMLTGKDGAPIALTTGEFDLLVAFVRHPQRVLNRDQLLDWTRGRSATPFDRTIDVQVSRLRRKLDIIANGDELIRTVRSGGYLFAAPVARL